MNVCLDVSAAVQQGAGISRYQRELLKHLGQHNAELPVAEQINYQLFYNNKAEMNPQALAQKLKMIAPLPVQAKHYSNKWWRLLLLATQYGLPLPQTSNVEQTIFGPAFNSPLSNYLFHATDYISPPLRHSASVVTVLDLSFVQFPQFHSRYNRNYLKLMTPLCVRKAQRVIVISESTRRDLIDWLGPAIAPKIQVTHLAADEQFFVKPAPELLESCLKRYGLHQRPYLLSVGTLEPRKNQSFLVQAYAQFLKNLPVRQEEQEEELWPILVLVGKAGWGGEYAKILEAAQKNNLSVKEIEATSPQAAFSPPQMNEGLVIILQGLGDQELPLLYRGALASCYGSRSEGFGFPPLESMACGTPVIMSNNSSLPELIGSNQAAAMLIESDNLGQLVQALTNVATNQSLRANLAEAGQRQAREFSWSRTAHQTVEVYKEALAEFHRRKLR